MLFPTKEAEQGKSGFVEEKDRRRDELKGRVERGFGFHKTYLEAINGTEQDSINGYKVWRIFVAEVTKKGENPP